MPLLSVPRRRSRGVGAAGLAVTAVLLLAACGDDSSSAATDPTPDRASKDAAASAQALLVGPVEGQALIAAGGVTVIDVRTGPEFAAGHLEGALNIDVEGGAFSAGISELDPSATYVVYCQSGRRSALAAAAMVDAGFTQVSDMGGIQDWLAAGLPVVSG